MKIKTILVATDFTEPSYKAVNYGIELAQVFCAKLHLLHVIQRPPMTHPIFASYQTSTEELAAAAQTFLDAAIDNGTASSIDYATEYQFGDPETLIAERADAINASLIVIGTHSYGRLKQALFGGVADSTIRAANCPVLTVHVDEHEFIHPKKEIASNEY